MYQNKVLDTLHRTYSSGDDTGKYSIENIKNMENINKKPSPILRVEGLVKIYGKRRVVDGVSFHVNKGEIVGLLGPNGAGKTTSFRMACGLINTNGGIVYLGSQDVTNWPMYRRSREGGMGYLPQDRSVFQKLSVQNNLYGVMEMLGMKRSVRKRRCDELLEKFQLTHLRYNYGGGLSGGERRRLEIARSLVSDPKIILLDEPFAAVDPITVTGIQEIIRQLSSEGISILITDHSVQDTLQITQRSYVIQAGQVLCHGTPEEVLSNPEARKVYFGENVNVNNLHAVSLHSSSAKSSEQSSEQSFEQSEEEKKYSRRIFGHKKHSDKPHESVIPLDPEWEEPLVKPPHRITLPATQPISHSVLGDTPEIDDFLPNSSPRPKLRRAVQLSEKINPTNSEFTEPVLPEPILPTRPIGKRLPTGQTKPELPPEQPQTESTTSNVSGGFQSFGSLIRRK
ncbi:MAG: LPS export ABC transporter ATP-binding protein [Planctomycetaceae bacterium]|jgi:lipopolysaccharide export system ATP-binding protein|nr:LPS export ABC transporter ATP-binding protein [Planctomycetaceae bacterium]